MRAFADALDSVPMALAENSGLSPIETLANIKSRQAKEKNSRLGVDCMQTGSNGKSPANVSLFRRSFVNAVHVTRILFPLARLAISHIPSTTDLFALRFVVFVYTAVSPHRLDGILPAMHGPVVHTRLHKFPLLTPMWDVLQHHPHALSPHLVCQTFSPAATQSTVASEARVRDRGYTSHCPHCSPSIIGCASRCLWSRLPHWIMLIILTL